MASEDIVIRPFPSPEGNERVPRRGGITSSVPSSIHGIRVHLFSNRSGVDARVASGYNLTPHVTSLTATLLLRRPWETLNLELVYENGVADGAIIPTPGDFLVFKSFRAKGKTSADSAAVTFTRVVNTGFTHRVDRNTGRRDTQKITVSSVNWFEYFSKAQVIVALQAGKTAGTFITRLRTVGDDGRPVRAFNDLIDSLVDSASPTSFPPDVIGQSLAKVWNVLGTIRTPGALGGQYLADLVPVVYNETTRNAFAPRMTIEPIPGWSLEGLKSTNPQGVSVVDLIMGTFNADNNLMELYPTLEPFGTTDSLSRFAAESAGFSGTEEDFFDIDDPPTGLKFKGSLTPSKPKTTLKAQPKAQAASVLGAFLGVNPVLVYRMKPWRVDPLSAYQALETSPARMTFGSKYPALFPGIFENVTWRRTNPSGGLEHGFAYSVDEIDQFTGMVSDADHINCVTLNSSMFDDPVKFLASAGLPIIATDAVEESGLRVFQPRWPFFLYPHQVTEASATHNKNDLITGFYTLALQAMQFMGGGDKYLRGTVSMDYAPELRPGMNIDIESREFTRGKVQAYVEDVTHSVNVNQASGAISAKTMVSYSRGVADADVFRRQFSKI